MTLDRLVDEAMLRLHAEERELAQLEDLDATYVRVHESSINHTGIAEATIRAEWKDLHDFDTTLTNVAHRLEPVHAGEPFAARRARALGVLADPARAAALLAGTPEADLPAAAYGIHLVVHTTTDTLTGANRSPASRPPPAAPAAPSSPSRSPPGAASPAPGSRSPPSSTSPTPSPWTATRSATGSAPG